MTLEHKKSKLRKTKFVTAFLFVITMMHCFSYHQAEEDHRITISDTNTIIEVL